MKLDLRGIGRLAFGLGMLLAVTGSPAAADGTVPSRVIAVGGSVTEIVAALGAQDQLAGIDSTSMYPPEVRALPDVGYLRALSAEPILALAPDLILAEADAGPPEAVAQLRSAGVDVQFVPDTHDIQGVTAKIVSIAQALGLAEQGVELANRVAGDYARVRAAVAAMPDRPSVMFVLSAGHGAPLTGGEGSSAEAMIQMAGGRNAISGFPDYRPLTPEAGIAAAPDVVLVTARSMKLMGGPAKIATLPGIAGTPAAENGRIVAMDGLLLLGFGPRTPAAVAELAALIRPAASE